MEIAAKYDPARVEERWYAYWTEQGFFESVPDDREPYTVVIPPPNVTGVLHMGHMLNNTLQDVLVRRARLLGKNACWVPGTDHASIATEAKVVAHLRAKGIEKSDLDRETFLEHAWAWKEEYGGVILEQLKKLGCSCDWKRTAFTMDEERTASVIKVFVRLFREGHIYRGHRMVNWDPEAKTTLSDEEVVYEERMGKLYHITYPLVGRDGHLTIATTRPETLFGDTAVCVNPDDERYAHLIGGRIEVPLTGREVPIIGDGYVDMEFGTGCLKVTPAHDENDYALGAKHGLDSLDIFDEQARLNAHGLHFEGVDRFEARKRVVVELEEKGLLTATEDHTHKVGTSERTKAVIEPRLSDQWFLSMEELVKPAVRSVLETREIRLYPSKFENTYRHWVENIRDWNISRQLWWGQQIPAYYYGDRPDEFVVAETEEEALALARQVDGMEGLRPEDLRQDPDVLDTWFSSWLWPISVFGGILEPDNPEVSYYYPTQDLVTGPDILFFWVVRMIMAGYGFRGERPFANVFLTGLVRDKQRRKMSKSLGNSPDALALIAEYGADGVRVGLLLSSAAGNDLMFDEALCQQGKNFANKIWNAFRLVKGWETSDGEQPESAAKGIEWYRARFEAVRAEVDDHFDKFRISDALMAIYKLVWDDFCSWLLEIVKPGYGEPIDSHTYAAVIELFEANLRLLHPFMPFLSEEVWQHIADRRPEEALCVARWPEPGAVGPNDPALTQGFDFVTEVIANVRTIRKEKQIPQKTPLELYFLDTEGGHSGLDPIVTKLANLSEWGAIDDALGNALSFRVGKNEYFVPVGDQIDREAEAAKMQQELDYTRGFLQSVEKKLANERFVDNAPAEVVAIERKKAADAASKIETLENGLKHLGK